jgi:endonuclease YncB( thermonuclease family)
MTNFRVALISLFVLAAGCGTEPRTEQLAAISSASYYQPVSNETSTPTPNSSNVIMGRVVGVTDGDTIKVLDSTNIQHKIRLRGIDAPESHQSFGTQSKKALSDKVFNQAVRVEWEQKDHYGRTLGHIYLDDRWINKEMIEEGFAWHYHQYSNDEDLATAQQNAKSATAGLWLDTNAIAPWDFRRNPSLADASSHTTDSAASSTTVYITRTGKKYHRDGCRYLKKSKIPISLDEAKLRYDPCKVCKPPI